MKLKLISDLHIDINKNYFNFKNNKDNNDFYVIAGDISSNRIETENFINENISKGVFVEGNHLGYNMSINTKDKLLQYLSIDNSRESYLKYIKSIEEKSTLNYSFKYLKNKFKNSSVKFLNNSTYIVNSNNENIVFAGCILYTDFNLFNNVELCKKIALQNMNDYKRVTIKENNKIKLLTTDYVLNEHKKSVKFITNTCKKYKNNKVVVVTHYTPSFKCISEKYKNDLLSASFASNLEYIMKENENLVLWCCGHVHDNIDIKIYNTRVVCNAFGYYNEREDSIINKNNISNINNYCLEVEI